RGVEGGAAAGSRRGRAKRLDDLIADLVRAAEAGDLALNVRRVGLRRELGRAPAGLLDLATAVGELRAQDLGLCGPGGERRDLDLDLLVGRCYRQPERLAERLFHRALAINM